MTTFYHVLAVAVLFALAAAFDLFGTRATRRAVAALRAHVDDRLDELDSRLDALTDHGDHEEDL